MDFRNFSWAPSVNMLLELDDRQGRTLCIKREDAIHPSISGNKFRKLKHNLGEAQRLGHRSLLTFGGAHSNHIAAVAAAGKAFGFATIGIIRGEELADKTDRNPTLRFAETCGMTFQFVSRERYRNKTAAPFLEALKQKFGDFYLIPEGGTNALAVQGCEAILEEADAAFDYVCCPVGTGGTLAGLANSSLPHQKILGFPALKGDFLREEIAKFAHKGHWDLVDGYHFGGYAKINRELIGFINGFKRRYGIPLDPIYTGKMMFGIFGMMANGQFPEGSKILAIHTGGLQGIAGMNEILKQKNLPLIR